MRQEFAGFSVAREDLVIRNCDFGLFHAISQFRVFAGREAAVATAGAWCIDAVPVFGKASEKYKFADTELAGAIAS
ncbi:hypothetical protein [Methylocella silvestris]|uniref:hypothetical protein n=1 Tax=Methylocella silvestris TaxID=199596 RepID=UPI0011D0DE4F|nr:hypothetical protein [Methylocella silvestris]